MKIAAAQINSTVGEIKKNLELHYEAIELAIAEKVNLISFPEMSLTGYCRKEAATYAFTKNDDQLNKLQGLAIKGGIVIVVGAPIRIETNLYIGSFIISPDKPINFYTKQHLHAEEALFFNASYTYNPTIHLGKEKIALAICADINYDTHPFQAKQNQCTIYLPSIFYSESGMKRGHDQLMNYAKKYSINILMSNYYGEVWGMKAGGKSAFWDENGDLLSFLNTQEHGLLIAEKVNDKWCTKKGLIENKTIKHKKTTAH